MAQSVFVQVGNPSSIIIRIELHFVQSPISVNWGVGGMVVSGVVVICCANSFLSLSKISHNLAFSLMVDFFFLVLMLLLPERRAVSKAMASRCPLLVFHLH